MVMDVDRLWQAVWLAAAFVQPDNRLRIPQTGRGWLLTCRCVLCVNCIRDADMLFLLQIGLEGCSSTFDTWHPQQHFGSQSKLCVQTMQQPDGVPGTCMSEWPRQPPPVFCKLGFCI